MTPPNPLTELAERREARLDARQARCQHRWRHATETVHNRLIASTWCAKCKITAFAFSRARAISEPPHD